MSESLYVPTDSKGIEHSSAGRIPWQLPEGDAVRVTELGHPLILRRPEALLDVLDERIYRAEALFDVEVDSGGMVSVPAARLIAQAHWDTEVATRFAVDCADHVLREGGDLALPNGISLAKVIDDARQILGGIAPGAMDHLGYLTRLRALRRLRHEKNEIAGLSLELLAEDEAHDIDALDDTAYATVLPIADSVLAAIEALRHHLLPELYVEIEEAQEEREEHRIADRGRPLPIPNVWATPFGPIEIGGPHILRYEPAWTSARDSARHARIAAKDRDGVKGETDERTWQARILGSYLEE